MIGGSIITKAQTTTIVFVLKQNCSKEKRSGALAREEHQLFNKQPNRDPQSIKSISDLLSDSVSIFVREKKKFAYLPACSSVCLYISPSDPQLIS